MKNLPILYFQINPITNPYPNDPLSEAEAWGRIRLIHESEHSKTTLLDQSWDVIIAAEYFLENRKIISITEFNPPFDQTFPDSISIAEIRDQLVDRAVTGSEDAEFEYLEKINEYFSGHFFKLQGTTTPLFYIWQRNGVGELSYKKEEVYKKYTFDMKHFIESSNQEFKNFFEQWPQFSCARFENAIQRIKNILKQL